MVEGESATAAIARIAGGEKSSWSRAARVAIHLARALECLHQHGLVHKNITPQNVLLQASDHATKLTDLAVAQSLEGSQLQRTVQDKKKLAELPYLAPEQMEPGGFVDGLADLYAVGAVSYALIAGRPPVAGNSASEVLEQIKAGRISRPSMFYKKVPAALDGDRDETARPAPGTPVSDCRILTGRPRTVGTEPQPETVDFMW